MCEAQEMLSIAFGRESREVGSEESEVIVALATEKRTAKRGTLR